MFTETKIGSRPKTEHIYHFKPMFFIKGHESDTLNATNTKTALSTKNVEQQYNKRFKLNVFQRKFK